MSNLKNSQESQQNLKGQRDLAQKSKSATPAAGANLRENEQKERQEKRTQENTAQDKNAQNETTQYKTTQHRASQQSIRNAHQTKNTTTINALKKLADVKASDPSERNAKTGEGPFKKVNADTAIKVWYDAKGVPLKYELFKKNANGEWSSNFYSAKTGELKTAKVFTQEGGNGTQVSYTSKQEIRQAHNDVKVAGNEKVEAFQKMAKSGTQIGDGYIKVNETTTFKEWKINGTTRYEIIDTQTKKSYFYDKDGNLILEKNLDKKVINQTSKKEEYATTNVQELPSETKKRAEAKLLAVTNPKPQGVSESLFHSDGREISAEVK